MRVRPMTGADTEEVAALCSQLGYPATPAEIAHRFGLLDGRDDAATFVVENADESIAGWIQVAGRVLLEAAPYAEIGGLVVDERMRGQGIGRMLMDAAEAWALRCGYDEVRLRSNIAREDAHTFYERLGYEPVATSHLFRKPL